ncbi:1,4-alpha-glucan branching protein GlgB [Arthrobacter sp. JSM 101049]|uniref:1,4-alpha-glucan branching protein GlgB n=1 Tax=Arthrobacter sp. JSM 101049 TaxID=929097 RepID=UPI0035665DEA
MSGDTGLTDALRPWLATQRWCPAPAGGSTLSVVGTVPIAHPDPEVLMLSVLLAVRSVGSTDEGTSRPVDDAPPVEETVIHVPLSLHRRPHNAAGDPVATLDRPTVDSLGASAGQPVTDDDGDWLAYDATQDPEFVDAWAAMMAVPGVQPGSLRVMHGEQSNTSVVLETASGPVIIKFFRVPLPGANPDVELGTLLSDAGSHEVPRSLGSLDGNWRVGDRQVTGTLSVVREFLRGSVDAWRTASTAAIENRDFTAEATELGRVVARLHRDLRSVAPTVEATPDQTRAFVEALRGRLLWGWERAAPADGALADAFSEVLESLGALGRLPLLQRIHGDLHLGQVLAVGERGWVVLDFEGEPLRTAADRGGDDVALRDVVGMLRSFDYAAGMATRSVPDGPASGSAPSAAAPGQDRHEAARQWSARTRKAFLSGYREESGEAIDIQSPLFLALWLDKALYEVVYEQQNRPSWEQVPASAVQEVLSAMQNPSEKPRDDQPHATAAQLAAAGTSPRPVSAEVLSAVAQGRYHAPHGVLGAHLGDDGTVTVRTLRKLARSVALVTEAGRWDMHHEHDGVWVAAVPTPPGREGTVPDYRLEVAYGDSAPTRVDDPYHYLPTLGEIDLHLIGEGRHERLWEVLGARIQRYHTALGDCEGTAFAVWAPNARAVRVVGDFNGWDGTASAMRSLGRSGVWEIFLPGVGAGSVYKFELLGQDGHWRQKADPMARYAEVPPLTGSIVVESSYGFQDDEWMSTRATRDPHAGPMSVYEVHLGSWRPGLDYRQMADQLSEYVSWQGFTHVEMMPVAEHPFGGSWGYQVTSYFAPTSRFGHPDDFRYLVDRLHQAGIGVIMDWVPAHFPKDEWALARFDGQPLYEHADPRRGEHPDWGTLVFDFGRHEVRNFLVANALYWLGEFHIDALRVDAVASMLYLDYSREDGGWEPNVHGGRENLEAISFLQELNATAYRANPGIAMIAEESTAFPGVTAPTSGGGLGFGLKWNMGWMHDSLEYMSEDPVNRSYHHHKITFSMVYAYTENFLLPISHDEVVHGKGSLLRRMPGDRWRQLAQVRAYLAFQWAHPGKQLIFMGTEFAQEGEWSEQYGLDWWVADTHQHRGVQLTVRALNGIYRELASFWELDNDPAGFAWINDHESAGNTLSFIRRDAQGHELVCVANFSGEPHLGYRLGLPEVGEWTEVLNTDETEFGGSGVGNPGTIRADGPELDGQPASATVDLPPLGVIYLVPGARN